MTTEYAKPLPPSTPLNAPYWESAKRHTLQLPRCARCEAFHYPPEKYCPHCLHDDLVWTAIAGTGTVYSFTIVHQKYHPAFETPYNVAVVELPEGPRLLTNIVGCAHGDVRVGMAVRVTYDDITEEFTLPKFEPA